MKRLIDFGIISGILVFSVAIAAASIYPFIKMLSAIGYVN